MMPTYLVEAPVMGGFSKIGNAVIEVEADSIEHAREVAGDTPESEWDIEIEWGFDMNKAYITEVE
jgi:hypothetical protein